MKGKGSMIPPECCVIIEMENGASLGYRKALLLNKIETFGSLAKAAKVSQIDIRHARKLVLEMNDTFSKPLVDFKGNPRKADIVELTEKGEKTARSYWRQFEPVYFSIMEERCRHY